jgi:formylglycine-generating enzyme required for sulfatase activity
MNKTLLCSIILTVSFLLLACNLTGAIAPTSTTAPTEALSVNCTSIGQTWTSSRDNSVLVCIPAGEFTMGIDKAETYHTATDDETPKHTVNLDAFWIDRTEVTNAQYKQCVQAGKCMASDFASESKYMGDTQPVIGMEWEDAANYCQWVGRQLPSEAQWEKAARGTDGRLYPWGDQKPTCDITVYAPKPTDHGCGQETTWPVGSKPQGASPYGALDMGGNVFEWVQDTYAGYPGTTYQDPQYGQGFHIVRGGSWFEDARYVTTTLRQKHMQGASYTDVGFRCVR